MFEHKNAKLKEFQAQAQRKYRHLNSLKKLEKEIQKESRERRYGFLFYPLYLLAGFFVKIAKKRKIYSIVEKEAGELLSRKEVKSRICAAFSRLGKKEIVTEEKFVDLITETVWETAERRKINISYDSYLSAEIAHRISEKEIEEFCKDSATAASK